MRAHPLTAFAACLALAIVAVPQAGPLGAQAAGRGSIRGRVILSGRPPGNAVIRMGMDPMCSRVNAGQRVVQQMVVTSADGGLANAFVHVEGRFPDTPIPSSPVLIDQRGCVYTPRVAGLRVGQTLQVRNSDPLLHNVHGVSAASNGFNVSEPNAGMVREFHPKAEEIMLRIKCDVHSWMTTYVGVVGHPYFAVSGSDGSFAIADVPAGARTVQVWHERYGVLTATARVRPGAVTAVQFTYTGAEQPAAAARSVSTR